MASDARNGNLLTARSCAENGFVILCVLSYAAIACYVPPCIPICNKADYPQHQYMY